MRTTGDRSLTTGHQRMLQQTGLRTTAIQYEPDPSRVTRPTRTQLALVAATIVGVVVVGGLSWRTTSLSHDLTDTQKTLGSTRASLSTTTTQLGQSRSDLA